ncbi:DNA-binding MarR family transcriptional regulator [Paenibacillus forsythiae]|uniref:DNA-binding MarR family transcriptional regulator n=1 Tax=Paenibacillus forsythiae TaxID=365616 RepID=A0ABU3H996_9BACL|nr:MarR family winged helix-turn-helix transcriptional regulator [Paenibacillus forsythiae]MDT3427384.1 DNA-binding MarR family transcriptional regulator [Paenibacillus forsythiae]
MEAIDKLRYLIQCAQREGNHRFTDLLMSNGLDITPSQSEVLTVLAKFGPMSIAELGDLLLCNSQHPSRLVQRLMDKQYIDKEISPHDSRKIIISLTPEGEQLISEIRRVEEIFNGEIMDKINSFEHLSLNDLNALLSLQVKGTDSEIKISRRFGNSG